MMATGSAPSTARDLSLLALSGLLAASPPVPAQAQPSRPEGIAVPGSRAVLTAHAAGAQIYECAADASGQLRWRFREPIATLVVEGRTVGRHFAGPTWQLTDGSLVTGKVTGTSPGATGGDIPWLRLEVAAGQGSGQFAEVVAVQRIATRGGTLAGTCDAPGALRPVPYSADYLFLAKAG
jgi:hypothetical protein